MIWLLKNCNLNIVKFILENGYKDGKKRNKILQNILNFSVSNNCIQIFKYVLSLGQIYKDESSFSAACRSGYLDIIKYIIDNISDCPCQKGISVIKKTNLNWKMVKMEE